MEPTPFVIAFGKRLKEVREATGMSQEQLAARSGLHRTGVTHIERATRAATLHTVEKLAFALGTQPSDLMPKLDLSRKGRVVRGGSDWP